MTTQELIGLVIDDYRAEEKRSLKSAICHSRALVRLFEHLPRTVADIERYKAQRLAEGIAPATLRNELSILRRGFSLAKDFGLVRNIPRIRFPRVCNIRTVTCTPRQAKKILAALEVLDQDICDLVSWLLLMGWRQGESRKLEWRDVSTDRESVQLPQNKSKNLKIRYVRLGGASRRVLERRWMRRNGDYVFHRRGRAISTFRGVWQRAVNGAGAPNLRPHDLRRVFAQLSIDAGVQPAVVMQIAGWQSLSTFLRYGIASGQMQSEAQDLVAAYFQE